MGNDINKWVGVGRLTRDMTASYTTSGMAVGKFSIAVNEKYKDKEEVSFFDVTVWGKTAEALTPYLVKGKQVVIVGKLKQERWEKDGQNHSKIAIVAEDIQLMGGGEKQESAPNRAEPARKQAGTDFPDARPFIDDSLDPPF